MKQLVATTLGLVFVVTSVGCASAYRAKRDYHNKRARQELRNGDLGDAIEQKRKANEAARDARNAPLP